MSAAVKVILREDMGKLGGAGDLVSVKPGYARNFLVPEGKATIATDSNIKELEHNKRVIAEMLAKELKDLRATSHKLKSMVLEVKKRAGEDGKLFGSVTSANIADLIEGKGVKLDRRKIQLPDAVKEVGEHTIAIKLHSEIDSSVKLIVSVED